MKFEEVIPALREGKKVTSTLVDGVNCKYMYYSPEDGKFYTDKGSQMYLFSDEFMKIDDWEIIKETKKVKLRDLTEEQYRKWQHKNCGKYDCLKCPFRCIDCNKPFWMSCKEMYSDKFLDQEVEIEEE